MARRKTQERILAALTAQRDGLPVRDIGIWSVEKLAILQLYFDAFTTASSGVGGGYYVDAMAGPGLCHLREAKADPEYVWGSPIVALRARPGFERCIFLEKDRRIATALEARTTDFEQRRLVYQGDVNAELSTLVRKHVPTWAPCFVLLDPEGMEVHWDTIRAVASVPRNNRKPELLILFPSSELVRLLPTAGKQDPSHENKLNEMMPGQGWKDIYESRLSGKLSPDKAKDAYAEFYRQGLEHLGYRAFPHSVRTFEVLGGRRREMYKLIFATQHERGEEIMRSVFKRPYVLDFPVSLQKPLFE